MASNEDQHCGRPAPGPNDSGYRYMTRNSVRLLDTLNSQQCRKPIGASSGVAQMLLRQPGVQTRLQKRKAEILGSSQLFPNSDVCSSKKEKFQASLASEMKSELTNALSSVTPASLSSRSLMLDQMACNLYSAGSNGSSASVKNNCAAVESEGFLRQSASRESFHDRITTRMANWADGRPDFLASGKSGTDLSFAQPVADSDNLAFLVDKGNLATAEIPPGGGELLRASSGSTEESHYSFGSDYYNHLLQREINSRKSWHMIKSTQKDVEAPHRKMMVNWLVEFVEEYSLQQETLFLGVSVMDAYLSKGPLLKRNLLQLLGMACILVAIKFEESYPPKMLQKCCDAAEGSFSREQVIDMESTVMRILSFDISIPTPLTFIPQFLRVAHADPRVEKLAEFFAQLALLDSDCLKFRPSVVAASSVLLALHTLGQDPWTADLQKCSGYAGTDLREAAERLHFLHRQVHCRRRHEPRAVCYKFEKPEYLSVSVLRAKENLPPCLYYNPSHGYR